MNKTKCITQTMQPNARYFEYLKYNKLAEEH